MLDVLLGVEEFDVERQKDTSFVGQVGCATKIYC
jgi:hypothetical protein